MPRGATATSAVGRKPVRGGVGRRQPATSGNAVLSENSDPSSGYDVKNPTPARAAAVGKALRRSFVLSAKLKKPEQRVVGAAKAGEAKKRTGRSNNASSSRAVAAAGYATPRPPLREFNGRARRRVVAHLSTPSEAELSTAQEKKSALQEENSNGVTGGDDGSSVMRRIKSRMLEQAMDNLPESGSGRVMHIVRAFESLLSISSESSEAGDEKMREKKKCPLNWALPGMQLPLPPKAETTEFSYPQELSFSEDYPVYELEADSDDRSSPETGDNSGSREQDGSQRAHCNSTGSLRRSWDQKLRVTNQQPFKLRTEQRGKVKEEQFIRKVQELLLEEERLRVHVAQGLPWTTDEPEWTPKPPIKDPTEPIDLVLHSDLRAVERAEFDHHVAERISFLEQVKLERERQQKVEEEQEIKHLRKELVPRALPMPDFNRTFTPKRSARPRTVPREPRFQARPGRSSAANKS